MTGSAKVKLCAIAKNEGAYIADWVHHHLYFGFDAIEIWVNGTHDPSMRILKRISAEFPQVTSRVADRLLETSLVAGKNFQHRAYARMARQAHKDGFTHAAFFDLDEYWVPLDGTSRIKAFLPDAPDVAVISFQWCTDVPSSEVVPFTPPVAAGVPLQLDAHVKSVVRLDGSAARYLTHSAQLRRGRRLLVRDPFPMVDERRQVWGSRVEPEYLADHAYELPEAFVLHAMNRSEREYLAKLADGFRQSGEDLAFKPNRRGYRPTSSPVLTLPRRTAWKRLQKDRDRFRGRVAVDPLVRRSQKRVIARADDLVQRLFDDKDLLLGLRRALRGITEADLDRRYPGWRDGVVEWKVDGVDVRQGVAHVYGWAFCESGQSEIEFALLGDGAVSHKLVASWFDRPDVTRVLADAPARSGFDVEVPSELQKELQSFELGLRLRGTQVWERRSLSVLAR